MSTSTVDTFDVRHAILLDRPLQDTMRVVRTIALGEALRQQMISPNTQVLVSDLPDEPLVFETWHLLAHPIAEGDWHGSPYAAAFCAVCNSAVLFNAKIGNTHFHFTQGGLYNGLMIIRDTETGSYWDHVTGECLYGASKGLRLERLSTLLFMTARQASSAYANAALVRAQLNKEQNEWARQRDIPRLQPNPDYGALIGPAITASLGIEDQRLPRLEMGLGIWAGTTARYYSLHTLREAGNVLVDKLIGRSILVYVDPHSNTPAALYVQTEKAAWQSSTTIRLDNGVTVRDGLIMQPNGEISGGEHPSQLFQRWMGFSLTFPNCQIYGK